MTPEEILLRHGELPYDPQKSREYYLRTRKLKGRQASSTPVPTSRAKGSATVAVKTIKNVVKPLRLTSKQRQESVNARVGSLRKRLDYLKNVLKDLLKEAESKEPAKKETTSNKRDSGKQRDQTVQQKREAAVRSKDFYDKNKKTDDSSDKNVEADIEKVREKIRKIRAQLKDAIENARQHSSKLKTVKGR